ncbi:MAG: PAS domain-containing sensor histidine kinase, partial [Crocinitomicaceae bacterium]|nr:PAS domain-containing sensor histidine kinase [Crocinitomicaceae bacterium]
ELEITTEVNQLFPVIFSLRPILNQSKAIAYVLAEARPIKELAEKTKRYEAIIQGANVGTWEWNIQTGEVLINNNWAKIIGYELEELIPMSIEKWRSLIHPEDLPFVERELVGVNWKSNNFFAIQMRIKHKLGHWVWVVDSGKVLDWSLNGDAQKMYGIHQDISEAMESKEELKRLLQTTQLQNEKQNQFTSILSHNLKSHGAAIIGLSELLMHDFPELAENQMFQLLLKGANDLNDTIDDVNEILKIKKDDDLYKQVSIAQLIEKILSSFQFHIQNANLEVHNNIDKAIKIWTIEPYLSSVIQNLITNAIKFKREDNGAFLKITYQKDGGCHVLLFEDNGLGINLEKHGKDIFGLYKTFHGFEDSKGLGLYMSKQHVEILGGTLSVSSAEKIGSTFKITLPV